MGSSSETSTDAASAPAPAPEPEPVPAPAPAQHGLLAQLCPVHLVHYLVGLGLLPEWFIGLFQEDLLARHGLLPPPGPPLPCGPLPQCVPIPQPGQPLQCGPLPQCVPIPQRVCAPSGCPGGGPGGGGGGGGGGGVCGCTDPDTRDTWWYFWTLSILVREYLAQLRRV